MSWFTGSSGNDKASIDKARLNEGKLTAIDKALAVIEFAIDGTVQHANENFLKALGYSLDEIVGRHHSMFVDPAERDSAAYRAFWDKLKRGDYDAGQYKRIGRDGREVWIQASYNPILGADGKPFKVVKYATDITAQKLKTADFEGQLAAIGTSQAVIAFGLDGKVLDANDNFLKALGYSLDEIKGQHHSLFVDAAERQSPEYRLFWENLARGIYNAGQYRRIGKGGREVWIQASYNPILDMSGKPFKVVKYATDITADKMIEFAIADIVRAAAAGDFSRRVPVAEARGGGSLGQVGEKVNALCETVTGALDDLIRMLGALAAGDLTQRITADYEGAFATLKADANAMAERIGSTIAEIRQSAREVTNAAAEIATSTTDLSQRTEEQAASLEQTSAAMEQMSATVKKNADNAQHASQSAVGTRDVAERGGQVVAQAVTAMARIAESSGKISDIIGVIDEIARQTNLLALNAAVEAARAGEAGRGFAVVASEVRSLAQRSSQAAKDIKDLINGSNAEVKDGVELVNKAGTALSEIVESIRKVAEVVSEIASASAEQATGLEEVNKAIAQMDEVTQQNSALVEENAATSKTLEDQAKAMTARVNAFRLAETAAEPAAPVMPAPVPAARPAPRVAASRSSAPPRAVAAGRGGGPVGRMQTALASAVAQDLDWKEF